MTTTAQNKRYLVKHNSKCNENYYRIAVKRLNEFRKEHRIIIDEYIKTGIVKYEDLEIVLSWKVKFEKYKDLKDRISNE